MNYRRRTTALCAGALAIGLAFAAPAAAQSVSPEAEIDALIDATATNAGAIATARAQAAGGDLLGAASALERALLNRPGSGSDDVRLYYATLLCALDDKRRAAYELGNVRDASLSGWTEARAACGDIGGNQPSAATRGDGVWGELSVGMAYDSDSYGALATEINIPTLPSLAAGGVSAVTAARLDAQFGTGNRSYFYAGLSFQSKDSVSGPKLDYQVGGVKLGFATKLGESADIAVGGVVRHAALFADPFVTEYGGQIALGLNSGERSRWSIDAEVVHQKYLGSVAAALRDGARYDLALVYTMTPRDHASVAFSAALELKDANLRTLGYSGGRVFAAAHLPIADNGTYLGLSATVRRADYRDPVTGPDLKEWRLFTRAAIGLPLGDSGLFVEPAVSYAARTYNAASLLRDYHSFGAELRLVYRFGN